MQEIFNEPAIVRFLEHVHETQRISTLKELILIGINVINSKAHERNLHDHRIDKENHQANNYHLLQELQTLRARIDQISAYIYMQPKEWHDYAPTSQQLNKPSQQEKNESTAKKSRDAERKQAGVNQNTVAVQTKQPIMIPKGRHHLDDSEVRKALVNPFAKNTPEKPKVKKIEKKFQYQEEINQQELKMIKQTHCQKEEAMNRSRRSRTHNPAKVESKIKTLVAQDKFKYRQSVVPEHDFNKYDYSDEESISEDQEDLDERGEPSSSQAEEYSSFQQPRQKFTRAREVDVVSNSSSFSKFSLSSQRQAGKISNRKK